MLRLFVLLLILANGVYFAWSQGLLRAYGFAPTPQSEPQRVAQQIRPELIQVLTPVEAKRAEAQAQAELAPKECLVAGPFDDAQAASLRQALEANLPPGSWQLDMVNVSARWIVYMGKFANAELLAKKRGELAAMRLVPQGLNNPDLEPGLSLGGFDTEAEAAAELAKLSLRGIRTAKVVQERQEGRQTQLKLPMVLPDTKHRLADLKSVLAGRSLRSCS
ncbi:MAG: SPOR domain-containing protein [Pseudomonadota bacterium]